MIIRKADKATEAGALPTTELISAMGDYMEDMAKAGVLLAGDDSGRARWEPGSASTADRRR
jgi:hypothetical protein